MTTADRPNFDKILDALADPLGVDRLTESVKAEYFNSFLGCSWKQLLAAFSWLRDNHKPFGRQDFPVPAEIHEAIQITRDDTYTGESRSYDEIKGFFLNRGTLIGDDARNALEKKRRT